MLKPPLRLAIIYAAKDRPTLVTSMHYNEAGICYEQSCLLVADVDQLVPVVRQALADFSMKDADLRQAKLSDWPSYRASGLKSVRQFQNEYLQITVTATNEAELFYEAATKPHHESDLTLSVLINRFGDDTESQRLLDKLVSSCYQWSRICTYSQ